MIKIGPFIFVQNLGGACDKRLKMNKKKGANTRQNYHFIAERLDNAVQINRMSHLGGDVYGWTVDS